MGGRTILYRAIKLPPRLLYAIGLGALMGRFVLLLTTRGRRTGRPRVTPLQYELVDGTIMVASARGSNAAWYRNLIADPRVEVRVKRRHICGIAEVTTDPVRIADFLQLRLERHPVMVGRILRSDGLPPDASRAEMERYATRLALVVIRPS